MRAATVPPAWTAPSPRAQPSPRSPPSRGLEAAEARLARGTDTSRAEHERVLVARSGDLAATWGTLAPADEGVRLGGWLRMWRRDTGAWRVLANVRVSAG